MSPSPRRTCRHSRKSRKRKPTTAVRRTAQMRPSTRSFCVSRNLPAKSLSRKRRLDKDCQEAREPRCRRLMHQGCQTKNDWKCEAPRWQELFSSLCGFSRVFRLLSRTAAIEALDARPFPNGHLADKDELHSFRAWKVQPLPLPPVEFRRLALWQQKSSGSQDLGLQGSQACGSWTSHGELRTCLRPHRPSPPVSTV